MGITAPNGGIATEVRAPATVAELPAARPAVAAAERKSAVHPAMPGIIHKAAKAVVPPASLPQDAESEYDATEPPDAA